MSRTGVPLEHSGACCYRSAEALRHPKAAAAGEGARATQKQWAKSLARFQDTPYISLPVQNGDNLKGRGFGTVNNGVVGIASERPETQRTAGEVGTGVAACGSFGDKGTGIIERLLDAVGGLLAVVGDVGPDIENVGFGEGRESVGCHSLGARFGHTLLMPAVFHSLDFTARLSTVNQLAALGL
jgi:hypothetical protein